MGRVRAFSGVGASGVQCDKMKDACRGPGRTRRTGHADSHAWGGGARLPPLSSPPKRLVSHSRRAEMEPGGPVWRPPPVGDWSWASGTEVISQRGWHCTWLCHVRDQSGLGPSQVGLRPFCERPPCRVWSCHRPWLSRNSTPGTGGLFQSMVWTVVRLISLLLRCLNPEP